MRARAARGRIDTRLHIERRREACVGRTSEIAPELAAARRRSMIEDVVIGLDGSLAVPGRGAGDTAFSRYHDTVWGKRTTEESALFEALTLGVFLSVLAGDLPPVLRSRVVDSSSAEL
jgi:hypothetical protein